MENLDGYINFWPEFISGLTIKAEDLCIIYSGQQILLMHNKEQIEFPTYQVCQAFIEDTDKLWYLGKWLGQHCFAYAANDTAKLAIEQSEADIAWTSFRDSRWEKQMELYSLAVKAQHLLNWDTHTQYCGVCGSPNIRKSDERAKCCPKCHNIAYPKISPAIIVGIKRDNQVLLAHNAGFREGLYSIIAGFVEQGESLEEAVKREVYEEVGIKVKNIKYHHSKPWNSLDSLMLGFTAEYAGGEIQVDGKEIVDAGWYDRNHLPPQLPDKISTARIIIDELLGLE